LKEKITMIAETLEREEAAYAAMFADGRDVEATRLGVEEQAREVADIALHLDGYREWLKDVEQQREGQLQEFRDAQGVWGDG